MAHQSQQVPGSLSGAQEEGLLGRQAVRWAGVLGRCAGQASGTWRWQGRARTWQPFPQGVEGAEDGAPWARQGQAALERGLCKGQRVQVGPSQSPAPSHPKSRGAGRKASDPLQT